MIRESTSETMTSTMKITARHEIENTDHDSSLNDVTNSRNFNVAVWRDGMMQSIMNVSPTMNPVAATVACSVTLTVYRHVVYSA